jgi:hypothetical protein
MRPLSVNFDASGRRRDRPSPEGKERLLACGCAEEVGRDRQGQQRDRQVGGSRE